MKPCRVCHHTKPYDQFYPRLSSPDGHRAECKDCTKARAAKSAHNRATERRAYLRTYESLHRDHIRAQQRHRSRTNQRWRYARAYRAQHLERILHTERSYRQRNRHKQAIRLAKRRALGLTPQSAAYIAQLLKDPCSYCGATGGTIDHIIPVTQGGTNDIANLTSACRSCNSSKHDMSLLTFLIRRNHG